MSKNTFRMWANRVPMATKVAATIATLTAPFVVVLGVALAVTVVLPGVTLTVDRTTYAVGETVRFALRNGLHDPVYLSCTAPWLVLRKCQRTVAAGGTARVPRDHRRSRRRVDEELVVDPLHPIDRVPLA